MDEVVGVLHLRPDSTPGLGNCGLDFIAKRTLFHNRKHEIDDLLREFQERKVHGSCGR